MIYVLKYTLSNILVPREDGYLLDHDFAFPQRPGVIVKFTLDCNWTQPGKAPGEFPRQLERGPLHPGKSVVLALPLRYTLAGTPSGVRTGPSQTSRYLLLFFLATIGASGIVFYRREASLGRFSPLPPPNSIDGSWLNDNLFTMLPEVAGAAWDDRTAAPEVAAVLARLVGEGKLESEIRKAGFWIFKRDVLHLKLLVDEQEFHGYELKLILSLFAGAKTMDTDTLTERYKNRGFDPADNIRSSLKRLVKALVRRKDDAPKVSGRLTLFFFILSLLMFAVVKYKGEDEPLFVPAGLLAALGVYVLALIGAYAAREEVHRPAHRFARFLIPLSIGAVFFVYFLLGRRNPLSFWILAHWAFVYLFLFHSVLNMAKTRSGKARIALKKKLCAAREYFKAQLSQPRPRLRDEWFPYIVAFGLGPDVDRWFKAYGAAMDSLGARGSFTGGSLSTSSSNPSWSGGGGRFGGAGASGSWAVAALAMGAGVSSPSSGGSGGGGGGGGGSSGGGGGGGW